MVELQGQGSGPQHCFAAPLAPLEQPLSLFPLSGFHSNHVVMYCEIRNPTAQSTRAVRKKKIKRHYLLGQQVVVFLECLILHVIERKH